MKILYRPDIDGLRAIAVLSVIFYHSMIPQKYFNLFHGGFLGVDIYLISIKFFLKSELLFIRCIILEVIEFKIFLLLSLEYFFIK